MLETSQFSYAYARKGILNECEYWPAETDEAYRKFGYDIVTFSNHNELTLHPYDSLLQVNVYEHGINLFKYHKLVFGCDEVNRFDHLIPLFASQKQFQLDLLGKESDFIQMNHPLRTTGRRKASCRNSAVTGSGTRQRKEHRKRVLGLGVERRALQFRTGQRRPALS